MTDLPLLFWSRCFSFYCLMAVARTSTTMLNRSGESRHSCIVPNLNGKAFSLSTTNIMLHWFFVDAICHAEDSPIFPNCRMILWEIDVRFYQSFFWIYRYDHTTFLLSLYQVGGYIQCLLVHLLEAASNTFSFEKWKIHFDSLKVVKYANI